MCRRRPLRLLPGVLAILLAAFSNASAQDAPLHSRIDQLIEADSGGLPLIVAGDPEFFRRISLHLTGMPPTPADLRAFLADQNPDKRAAAIDRLLASPQHARRMAEFLDVTFMERRANTVIPQDEWMAYLVQSTRTNKSWLQFAREILTADGTDDDPRAAARFLLDRGSEPNLITRDVGRIFFGRDMQCAQCHDHPLIDDYLQIDYHGLYAFFAAGAELKIKEGDKERIYYAERAGSDGQYESVFNKGVKHLTGPRVPGDVELVETAFIPGEEYDVAPADNTRPVPKVSRRAELADIIAAGTNRAFNENIANRLWALMMGRGLVHPVDLHHSANPPSHPELLRLLGEQIAAMNYDMRAFLRELALTRVYQRTYDLPPDLLATSVDVAALEQQRAQLVAASEAATAAFNAALDQWNAAQAALLPVVAEADAVRAKYSEILKRRDDARKAAAEADGALAAKQVILSTVSEAAAKAQAAAATLPQDQELAAAAAKFAERTTQLTAEIEPLKATAAEKTAAIAAPQAELDAARPTVEAALQKTEPQRAASRDAERHVLTARIAMMSAVAALYAHDERIKTAHLAVAASDRRAAAIAAAELVPVKAAEATAAAAQAAEFVAMMNEQLAQLQTAEQQLAAAGAELAQLQQSHAQQASTLDGITSAASIVADALAKTPDDAPLQQALALLQTRATELTATTQGLQTQVETALAAHQAQAATIAARKSELGAAQQEKTRRDEAATAAAQALEAARAAADAAATAARDADSALAARRTRDCQLAELQPLSPEELCWSIFQVTDVYRRYWDGQAAELDKAQPLTDEIRNDPARMAARMFEIEQRTYDQLKGNVASFASLFGNGPGQPQTDFFATADQALFVANGGSVVSWVAPSAGNVTERIINQADPQAAAEDLYLTVLSRPPTDAEVADVAACFNARPNDRPAAAQELVWALIASAEFRFNH